MSTPAYCRPAAYETFAEQLPHIETTVGLFRAAFAIAQHERPTANLAQAEVAVQQLVDTVRRRVHTPSADAKLAHLHDVLFDVIGFHGNVDDYYDPANSYLPEVLKSRRGTADYACARLQMRRGGCRSHRSWDQFAGAFPGGGRMFGRDFAAGEFPTFDVCRSVLWRRAAH